MAKGSNRFKSMSQARAGTKKPDAERDEGRVLADYETPTKATLALATFIDLGRRPKILEPAAGSGRMVRALQSAFPSATITARDIKGGKNFLARDDKPFTGHVITNPPYGRNIAEPFIRKALTIADGKVAMLMGSNFLFSAERGFDLYRQYKPELVIVIPWRVRFIDGDGVPIKSQMLTNVWIVWPERERRDTNRTTLTEWAQSDCDEIAMMIAV